MRNPFKKQEYVKVTLMDLNKNKTGGGIMVDCKIDPTLGMSLLLGGLLDMAERFQRNHAKKDIKCDCLGIRYATLITHHVGVIHNEMSKIKLKK